MLTRSLETFWDLATEEENWRNISDVNSNLIRHVVLLLCAPCFGTAWELITTDSWDVWVLCTWFKGGNKLTWEWLTEWPPFPDTGHQRVFLFLDKVNNIRANLGYYSTSPSVSNFAQKCFCTTFVLGNKILITDIITNSPKTFSALHLPPYWFMLWHIDVGHHRYQF